VWEDVTETCAIVVERAHSLIEDWHLANGLTAASLYVAPVGTQPTAISTDISAVTAVVPAVFQPAAVSASASVVPAAGSAVPAAASVVPAAVSAVPAAASVVPAAVQPRWQPPEHGRMKCNVDAAFSSQRNKTGVGICIRDEDGVFVLARTVPFIGVYPVCEGGTNLLTH